MTCPDMPELTLVVPCYNEEKTLEICVRRCLALESHGVALEIIIVDDGSTDETPAVARQLAENIQAVRFLRLPRNMGKGYALRAGFREARGKYVGVQDGDTEYNPLDYLNLLKPLQAGLADVTFGSRYLKADIRRVLYFWHTWMNKTLTLISNMFTNLDITDMETCYKLFHRDALQKMLPLLQENRFGFEPEITSLVARLKLRVYECAISYLPRTYEEGKKIGWKDGLHALYCIFHYGAPHAALPMQLLLYFFIGAICAIADIALFAIFTGCGLTLFPAVAAAFFISALLNYLLCIAILFRHKARWTAAKEIAAYAAAILLMCLLDYYLTLFFVSIGVFEVWSKCLAAFIGFIGNFLVRRYVVF